jgi:hypothetical protein
MTDKRTTWKINQSRRDEDWIVIIGPYDEGFVEAVKRSVPTLSRQWDATLKAWKVHKSYRKRIEEIIEQFSTEQEPAK